MMRSKWRRRAAALLSVALLTTACASDGDPESEDTPTEEETATEEETPTEEETTSDDETEAAEGGDGELVIGTLLPETGDLAVLGPAMVEAVKLAVQQIQDAGGVPGMDLRLELGDSGTNEDVANSTADRLLQSENADAIIGAASTRITTSVIDKITGAGVVECSPSNTGSSLTTYEDEVPGFYFRTAPPDNLQGPALAQVIVDDGHADVAVIALNDDYGQGFAGFLKESLEEAGASIVADVAYDPNASDFSADVQTVLDSDPDAVAVISFPDTGTNIITGLLEGGLTPDQLYTADGMQGADVITQVDPDDESVLNGMKGTAPSSQGSEAFATAFEEFAPEGTPQIFSAHAYDCANIIAIAAAVAGTDDPAAIAAEMVGVTKDGEACTDFASCLEVVEAGGNPDYNGASGPGEWVEEGEPAAGTYAIWEFRDGDTPTLDTIDVG